jgi:hypothetical protein
VPAILLDPGSALITSRDAIFLACAVRGSIGRSGPLLTRADRIGAALLTQVRQCDPAQPCFSFIVPPPHAAKMPRYPAKYRGPHLNHLYSALRAGVCALMLLRRYSRGCGLALCCCQSHSERSDDQLCSERRQAVRADTVRLVDAAGQYHAVWRPDAAFLISHLGVGAGASATSGGAP